MYIEIDFNSEEAIYIQLRNQIIMGIATSEIQEGESLPSVRQLAETVGINMHTVNKAYSVLKQEGYIQLDRRRGAVISLDINKIEAIEKMRDKLRIVIARGLCKNISREEVHELVDEIFEFIKKINKEMGVTIVIIEQNAEKTLAFSDYAYVISEGQTVIEGTGEALMKDDQVQRVYLGMD